MAAREKRKAAVVRDGRTLYNSVTYKRIDPKAVSVFSNRDDAHVLHGCCVFYPDGVRCMVDRRRPHVWQPELLTRPWDTKQVLTPIECNWKTSSELTELRLAALSRSHAFEYHAGPLQPTHLQRTAFVWPQYNLHIKPCSLHDNDAGDGGGGGGGTMIRAPGCAWTAEELARVGMSWAINAWQPVHLSRYWVHDAALQYLRKAPLGSVASANAAACGATAAPCSLTPTAAAEWDAGGVTMVSLALPDPPFDDAVASASQRETEAGEHKAATDAGLPSTSSAADDDEAQLDAALDDLCAHGQAGGRVKISLTVEMKNRIFHTKPHVLRHFRKLVYRQGMDEREFWMRYFRSRSAYRHPDYDPSRGLAEDSD